MKSQSEVRNWFNMCCPIELTSYKSNWNHQVAIISYRTRNKVVRLFENPRFAPLVRITTGIMRKFCHSFVITRSSAITKQEIKKRRIAQVSVTVHDLRLTSFLHALRLAGCIETQEQCCRQYFVVNRTLNKFPRKPVSFTRNLRKDTHGPIESSEFRKRESKKTRKLRNRKKNIWVIVDFELNK